MHPTKKGGSFAGIKDTRRFCSRWFTLKGKRRKYTTKYPAYCNLSFRKKRFSQKVLKFIIQELLKYLQGQIFAPRSKYLKGNSTVAFQCLF